MRFFNLIIWIRIINVIQISKDGVYQLASWQKIGIELFQLLHCLKFEIDPAPSLINNLVFLQAIEEVISELFTVVMQEIIQILFMLFLQN